LDKAQAEIARRQIGVFGLGYVGAHELRFAQVAVNEKDQTVPCQGLLFKVNGPSHGPMWQMLVTLDGDTYTVRLLKHGRDETWIVLDSANDVYNDKLREVIAEMYDAAIRERNQGEIPI